MGLTGQSINMLSCMRELEQFDECRGLEPELEQCPDEFEQQCGLALRLHFPHNTNVYSGKTGIDCPALGEI